MARPIIDRLRDIQTAAVDAHSYGGTATTVGEFAQLLKSDSRTYRALKNALTEIGEAIKDVTDKEPGVVERWPKIDWRGFTGLRDIISHSYFNVEVARLHPVVVNELPSLQRAVSTEIRRVLLAPMLETIRTKKLAMPSSESDLLDTLATYCTEDQIPELLGQAQAEMTDVTAFLKARGIPLHGHR